MIPTFTLKRVKEFSDQYVLRSINVVLKGVPEKEQSGPKQRAGRKANVSL